MTSRKRETYDASWDAFEQHQLKSPTLTDKEWAEILAARAFHRGEEGNVRFKIATALMGFTRMSSGYLSQREYRKHITPLLKMLPQVMDLANDLDKFNYQRFIMVTAIIEADPEFNHSVLTKETIDHFTAVTSQLHQMLRTAIARAPKEKTGPDNEDVFWLVRALNSIVRTCSDGGPLTLSKKRPGVGNDIRFVAAVLKAARRLSGRKFDEGTLRNSIRRLKKTS